jgi:uncharacterized protein DUF4286
MAAKKGDGLLMVYCDVAAEHEEEFNRWYNEEHIPERLAIPGVLNAARYQAVAGGPKYLACYELASPEAWHTEAWQRWLRNPTPWSPSAYPRASLARHTSGISIGASILTTCPRRRRRLRWRQSSWSGGCPSRRRWRPSLTRRITMSDCPCASAFRATSGRGALRP